jgi:GT2 family glycosyltransferase
MYGKEELTNKCVKMVAENYGTGEVIEILVVDDGSEKPYENNLVNVLRLDENKGFTNAVNQGILWCRDRFDYIHLLNNDTEPQPNFLKELVDVMEANPVIGIAGSIRILETDTPHKIELYGADLIRGYQQMCADASGLPDIIYTHWIPLCSALIRMETIRYIGLLDRRMKIWCSDNDYCIRSNFGGYNVALVPKSVVKHIHQATTNTVQSKYSVEADQRVLIEKMAGMQYAELMKQLPLDAEQKTYGKITFEVTK